MKTLQPNWFAEGVLDVEHKRYILLGYLQEVEREYKLSRIYPALENLDSIVISMLEFRAKCESLSSSFPKSIKSFNVQSSKMIYESNIQSTELLEVIYEVLEYSIPKIEEKIEVGKEIYSCVEKLIVIEPLGVLPIYKDEGYFLIQNNSKTEVDIFSFKMFFLEEGKTNRVLQTKYLGNINRSLSNTFYNIKNKLIKDFKHLPNPATFIITSSLKLPFEATLLPVAKRLFLKRLITQMV